MDLDRLIDGHAAHPCFAGQRSARCRGAQPRQVERLGAGVQLGQRPVRKRPQTDRGIERLRCLPGRRWRAHRCLQGWRGQRAGECEARLPCGQVDRRRAGGTGWRSTFPLGRGGSRRRSGRCCRRRRHCRNGLGQVHSCVDRHRQRGGDAQGALGLQPIPAESQCIDAVQRAACGAQVQLCAQVTHRCLAERGGVQFVDAQQVDVDLHRERQARGRFEWLGGVARCDLDIDAASAQFGQSDAQTRDRCRALVAALGKRGHGLRASDAQAFPARRVEHDAVAPSWQRDHQPIGIEVAQQRTARRTHLDSRQHAEHPGRARRREARPPHGTDHRACEHAKQHHRRADRCGQRTQPGAHRGHAASCWLHDCGGFIHRRARHLASRRRVFRVRAGFGAHGRTPRHGRAGQCIRTRCPRSGGCESAAPPVRTPDQNAGARPGCASASPSRSRRQASGPATGSPRCRRR